MNRRSFFKSLALIAGAAAAAPQVFVPKFEPVHWRVIKPEPYKSFYYEINPEWIAAPYEMAFVSALNSPNFSSLAIEQAQFRRRPPGDEGLYALDRLPLRFREENGVLVRVNPFILKEFSVPSYTPADFQRG